MRPAKAGRKQVQVESSEERGFQTKEECFGGSFLQGKTSNLELDAIFKSYLPEGSTLPCSTLPYLTTTTVESIRKKLKEKRRIFFPIFVRHHWIAGVLRMNPKGKEFLGYYDSAPSRIVHKDFKRSLAKVWPRLQFYEEHSAHQARGSDDCGLYMTAAFFAMHLNETVADPDTIGDRLRPFLAKVGKIGMDKPTFLQQIRDIIVAKSKKVLEGGSPEHARVYDPFLEESQEGDTNVNEQVIPPNNNREDFPMPPSGVQERVQEIMSLPEDIIWTARKPGIGHQFVATALATAADGVKRSIKFLATKNRMNKLSKEGRRPTNVEEALRCYEQHTMQWTGARSPLPHKPAAIFLQAENDTSLPEVVGTRRFVIGALNTARRLGTRGEAGPYPFSVQHNECEIGLYLPFNMSDYKPKKRKGPTARKREPTDNQECVKISDDDDDSDDEFVRMLKREPKYPLNRDGSPQGESVTCPRSWHIYSHTPPHVSAVAWNSITKDMRQHHIRCLHALKSMPYELLQQNIASSALECVRRDAVARGWGPSTVAKRYAGMAGALRDLPLYTTEKKGILLTHYPEWRAAQTTIRRMEREMDPQAYPPVNWSEYQGALKRLRIRCPKAAVFLAMMWALAARAGDIDCLRSMDVQLTGETKEDGTVPLSVTQKFGKGTRFRGTYWPASNIPLEEAAELRRIMHRKKPKERLFPPEEDMRTIVREALRSENRRSALPSIRRGAIQHLAKQGLPEETLMRLTGHTRLETLYRYIGHGRPITKEAVAAQERVSRLHRPEQSS